ncbi:hypothetical protein BARRETLEMON_50 [Arthrobacter phage BarretLemon]|uniref:Uncharacterized protein n=3 Tax=Marthavirus barretlemon TaxID=2560300 RepID=A0A386KQ06_9CAUD|nr:hypothetical protein BJD79_gp50 [Arthrobacter phage BarretLemon]AMM44512.1 hypothetical protein BARRETLEMON_50 [Arthrobacter phage BarretLemon]ASR78080.1 hypothetical protein SEA_TIMINATOR_50 [Arthrobacter phage Timinator]AYD86521.1 hypothetical protein SEA_LEEROYJ_50 [Arthrobacter phage LeeroyJ]
MNINIFSININIGKRESVSESEPDEKRETSADALVERADDVGIADLSSRDGRHDIIWESKQRVGFRRNNEVI